MCELVSDLMFEAAIRVKSTHLKTKNIFTKITIYKYRLDIEFTDC